MARLDRLHLKTNKPKAVITDATVGHSYCDKDGNIVVRLLARGITNGQQDADHVLTMSVSEAAYIIQELAQAMRGAVERATGGAT